MFIIVVGLIVVVWDVVYTTGLSHRYARERRLVSLDVRMFVDISGFYVYRSICVYVYFHNCVCHTYVDNQPNFHYLVIYSMGLYWKTHFYNHLSNYKRSFVINWKSTCE